MPRVRNQRGVVFPSPVVMLSIIAVAMAGVAFFATKGQAPTEQEVLTVSRPAATSAPSVMPTTKAKTIKPVTPVKPAVNRGATYVEVYNNSGITGLAGRVAAKASDAGWQVVGSDNWYGTVPTTTVYYPKRLEAAAKALALDLGIHRVMPAIEGPMRLDRLTVVLTANLS